MIILYLMHIWFGVTSLPNIVLDSTYTESALNKILVVARKEKDHQLLADVYYKLAELEEIHKVNPVNAFEYFTRSLDYYKITQDTTRQNIVNERIASYYLNSDLFEESLSLYNELLDYYKSKGDVYNQLNISLGLSEVFKAQGDFEKEKTYIQQSKTLNNSLGDTTFTIKLLLKEVVNFEELMELDSAESVAYRAFTLATLAGKNTFISKSLFHLGLIKEEQYDFEQAKQFYLQSLDFESNKKYNEDKLETYKHLANCFQNQEAYEDAFLFSDLYNSLKDSIINHDRQIAVNNISQKYESRMNKKEIKILELEKAYAIDKTKQQNRAITVLTIGFGLLSLAVYYIMRFYSQKIKSSRIITLQNEKINSQKIKELENNMKMKGMQSMIEGQEIERERISKDLHDSLGGLLSTIKLQFGNVGSNIKDRKAKREYNKANQLIDGAVEEVRSISRNLQPVALRNLGLIPALKDLINRVEGENSPEIHFQHYDLPKDIPNMVSLSIYRIIQEMLNNAIKHSEASEILLQLTYEEDEIVLLFEDDGIGFDIDNQEDRGMGLENIQSRADYMKGTLHIDSRLGEGTTYMLHIQPRVTDS